MKNKKLNLEEILAAKPVVESECEPTPGCDGGTGMCKEGCKDGCKQGCLAGCKDTAKEANCTEACQKGCKDGCVSGCKNDQKAGGQ